MTDPVPAPRDVHVVGATSDSITISVGTRPGPRLYHYTSGAGLKGIIENRELWATHIYYLNDHTEYAGTFEMVKSLLPRRTIIRNLLPSLPHLEKALTELHPYERGRLPCIFVTCFSEDRDDLSQWRGYTQPGGGYALGFDQARLQARAEVAGYRLVKVEYGQEGLAASELQLIPLLEKFITEYPKTGPDTPQRAQDAVASLRLKIQEFAPYMKHWAFHGEREWRLISPPYDDITTKFEYRQGASFLVPYLKFDLGNPKFEDIPEVVIGPGPNSQLAQQAAMTLALQNGINISSMRAQAPYRPW